MAIPSFDSFLPCGDGQARDAAPCCWFILRGSDLLVVRDAGSIDLPRNADIARFEFPVERAHLIGTVSGSLCRVLDVPLETPAPDGWKFEGVRSLFGTISESFFSAAARALEISEWDRTHRFAARAAARRR